MKRRQILAVILSLTVLMGLCSACSGDSNQQSAREVIGISMHSSNSERWIRDGETLKTELEEKGYDVALIFTEGGDQSAQIDELLKQNIKVLVVAADEPGAIGPTLEKVAGQGVKVLAYDRMPMDTDAVDAIATFDSREVGRLQARCAIQSLEGRGVLNAPAQVEILGGNRADPNAHWVMEGVLETLAPYIESGEIADPGQADELLADSWSRESGQDRTKALLDAGRTPNAILCGDDNILAGCIAVLEGHSGLPNPILVGQDAAPEIAQHISRGQDKTVTVFKDSRLLADKAAELADTLAQGTALPTADDTLENGKKDVNAYFAPLQTVDFFNYRTALIESGYYTAEQLNAEPDETITREEVLAQLFTFEKILITDTEAFALRTKMAGELFPGVYLNMEDNPTRGDAAAAYKTYCVNTGLLADARKELSYSDVAELQDWMLEALEFCNYYGMLDWVEGDQLLPNTPLTRLEAEQMYLGLVQAIMNQYDSSMRTEGM